MYNIRFNTHLSVHLSQVDCSNSSINYTTYQAYVVGNIAYIYLFGQTTTQLQANKAYFIPKINIVGYEGREMSGVGITETIASNSDGADSYTGTVRVDQNCVCITPTVTIPYGYGVSIMMLCLIL